MAELGEEEEEEEKKEKKVEEGGSPSRMGGKVTLAWPLSLHTPTKAGFVFSFSPFIGIDEMSSEESSLRKKLFFGRGSFEKRVSILLSSASIVFLSIPLDS